MTIDLVTTDLVNEASGARIRTLPVDNRTLCPLSYGPSEWCAVGTT